MASRPRRSAAQKAHEAITDLADSERATTMSTRPRRSDGRPSGVSVTRGPPSSPGHDHLNLTVKVSSNKLREATSGRHRASNGGRNSLGRGEIVTGKRTRVTKRSYVESDSLDDDDDDDDEMEDLGDDDANGDDDEMEADADGDEDDEDDADGDVDMDGPTANPKRIKLHNPKASKPAPPRRAAAARVVEDDDDDDEDELSEIEVSDPENAGDMSINVGGGQDDDDDEEDEEDEEEGDEEEDAEGEDDEMEQGQDEEVEDDDAEGEMDTTIADGPGGLGLDSDDDGGSRGQSPDLNKMTRRQRARFEEEPQSYMKLSDEVQAKKVFTAEELSMRRQEMARRRRNLSDKRNEEVKMETINKLLKKQAPKTTKKNAAGGEDGEGDGPDPTMIRWVSTKQGSVLGVPGEMVGGPAGKMFTGGLASGKMVEEVK